MGAIFSGRRRTSWVTESSPRAKTGLQSLQERQCSKFCFKFTFYFALKVKEKLRVQAYLLIKALMNLFSSFMRYLHFVFWVSAIELGQVLPLYKTSNIVLVVKERTLQLAKIANIGQNSLNINRLKYCPRLLFWCSELKQRQGLVAYHVNILQGRGS